MATRVHRKGLGIGAFLRSKIYSPDRTNGTEKFEVTNSRENDIIAKVEKLDDKKTTNEIYEASGRKSDDSKESSKNEKLDVSREITRTDEKSDDSEARREYVIKDDVGQVKLVEIINNSIKEAVLNIVKVGACPQADSSDLRGKEPYKNLIPSNVEETRDKENKPDSPKDLSLLRSSADKTPESHLSGSQYQASIQHEPTTLTEIPRRTSDHEKPIVDHENRELSPRDSKERETKSTKPTTRQREKKLREISTKISRQANGSSHTRTDNRRMTGNVNIYICSEANENTKDSKKKQKNEERSVEESETASESKTCDSNLSISTSKLVAALRNKKRKNLDNRLLSCLCEKSEDSRQDRSIDNSDEPDDDVLGNREDNRESKFPDYRSSSSRDGFIGQDGKFSDLDFSSSDIERDSDLESFDRYTPYDKNNSWSYTTDDGSSYENNFNRSKRRGQGKFAESNNDENCPCCSLKRCQKERDSTVPFVKDRKASMEKSYNREISKTTSRYPSIVEEEDEDYRIDKEGTEKKFTVNGNHPIDSVMKKLQMTESSKAETKKVRTSRIVSTSDTEAIDKKNVTEIGEDDVREDDKSKNPQSPNKKSKQSFVESESKVLEGEGSKNIDDGQNNKTEENAKIASKSENKKSPVLPDKKRNTSFFWRSMEKAMSIVKTRKDEDTLETEEPKKIEESITVPLSKPKTNSDVAITSEKEKSVSMTETGVNPEKRSRTRISNAIANRKSSIAATGKSFSPSISPVQADPRTEKILEPIDQGESEKFPEICDCRCKRIEPVKDASCKCCTAKFRKFTSDSSVCCKRMETPGIESRPGCSTCQNPTEGCNCHVGKVEPIEPNSCQCCSRCGHPLLECKCCCIKQDKLEKEFCKCFCHPKDVCRCDSVEKNRASGKSQPVKRRSGSPDFEENHCDRICHDDCCERETKSMICIYCDKPREFCICNAPIRKCSQCCLPLDVCSCKPTPCCDCNGRQILPTEDNNEATICVTAWKPRRNVRRYFARSIDKTDVNYDEDCSCWENSKTYGSNGLAYQKQAIFSDVMSELQQKISGSVCCNICGKVPCCCCRMKRESEGEEKIQTRPCPSTIEQQRSRGRTEKRSRSKSPIDSCKCGLSHRRKNNGKQSITSRICERCGISPCRCKRSGKSFQKKPQAKCYYCKTLPCTCVPVNETANSRPFRNADSSDRRRKERVCSIEENIDSENNGYRGRDNKRFVPCPGNQKRIRKYCCREKLDGSNLNSSNPVERVG